MKHLIFILTLWVIGQSFGQKENTFRLPGGANGKYNPGVVLAKLKPEFSGVNVQEIIKQVQHAQTSTELVNSRLKKKLAGRQAPRLAPSGIDINLYHEIRFSGVGLETFINSLFSTGYFELVEPDYTASAFYSPNDERFNFQWYLSKIKAPEAWDLTKGSSEIVIGIVDSGGDLDHPDLASKLYFNNDDPIDGIDNDEDGYVDNYRGWDFMGTDTLNAANPNFLGDNDPNNFNGGLGSHGSAVAGCAAAATDNGVGIAGVGFNTKLLFTKQSADNQGSTKGGIYRGYAGILYAATHGAKIINCSWGGSFFSQINQDLITYVTLDLGCLIVAAAGNDNSSAPSYPAAFDHVLSVASTNQNDIRSSFSNYGNSIDLSAPGESINTTFFNDTYATVQGTSFSAPITAGAAALVWAANTSWTPTQVSAQLRATADPTFYSSNASTFAGKLGKGRLDVYRALTKIFPALIASNPKLLNANGTTAEPGQDAFLTLDFFNQLASSSAGLSITLSTTQTGLVTINQATIQPGSINAGETINNKLNPFKLKLASSIPNNTTLDFKLQFTDGEYSDFQYLSFIVNPTFLDIDVNQVITTIASNGRLGYEDSDNQANGVGFVFNDNKLLYEMGLIMGNSTSKLFDNVRSTNGGFNQEFTVTQKIKEQRPGERSFSEIFGAFTDNAVSKTVSVNYRTLVWNTAPYDNFVILEYKVKNISGASLNNFFFGLFADWDITDNGGGDFAKWNSENNLGYVHPALSDDKPHAGIRLLKGIAPGYYAIDNNQNTAGTPFGLYDGFTDSEKFTSLSSGLGRLSAGQSTISGNDVSHVVSAGPYNIAINEEITIAFALVAGQDFNELVEASQQADTAYNFMLTAAKPEVTEVETCYGQAATLSATGADSFKWYTTFTGGEPFHSGPSFTTGNLFRDTTFFVSNSDDSFESVRSLASVIIRGNPSILSSNSGTICEGESVTLSVAEADTYLWSTGASTQTIEITSPGIYSVHVETSSPDCAGDSEVFTLTVNPVPEISFTVAGDFISGSPLTFTNNSTGAATYLWNFGNNQTSTLTNPTHEYNTNILKTYIVSLTGTTELGCSSSESQEILVITGIEESGSLFRIYPNPANDFIVVNVNESNPDFIVLDLMGKRWPVATSIHSSAEFEINVSHLPPGVYLLQTENKHVKSKFIIRR